MSITVSRAAAADTVTPNRWLVLAGATIALLCGGALYSFSVFAAPFAQSRGWAIPAVMFAFGLTSMLAPLSMIGSGILIDRGHTRMLMVLGGVLFGLGHVLAGLASDLALFYLSYGIVAGLGQGIMYSAALSNTLKFFPDKRGLASGVITGGMGAGSMIAAPLGRALVDQVGVSRTFVILGVAFALVVAASGLFLVRQCPMGYAPPGWTPPVTTGGPGGMRQLDWKKMLATPQFWLIIGMFVCGAFFGLMVTSNLATIGTGMFALAPAVAALFVSLLSFANTMGRLAWGAISDRIGQVRSLIAVFVIAIAALLLLGWLRSAVVFTLGTILLGFAFGGVMSLFPPLTMRNYGPKNQGVNYGIVFSAFALSGLVAPSWAGSMAAGAKGDYSQAFFIAAGIAAVGIVLTLTYRAVERVRPVQGHPAS